MPARDGLGGSPGQDAIPGRASPLCHRAMRHREQTGPGIPVLQSRHRVGPEALVSSEGPRHPPTRAPPPPRGRLPGPPRNRPLLSESRNRAGPGRARGMVGMPRTRHPYPAGRRVYRGSRVTQRTRTHPALPCRLQEFTPPVPPDLKLGERGRPLCPRGAWTPSCATDSGIRRSYPISKRFVER